MQKFREMKQKLLLQNELQTLLALFALPSVCKKRKKT